MNAIETALYNVIVAASTGVNLYNEFPLQGVAMPYAVFDFVSSDTDDTGNTASDILVYDIKVIDDSNGGQIGSRTSASYADKIRVALAGPATINVTGSLAGYTCTDCRRTGYIKYLDGDGMWHVGWQYRFRITK